MNFSRQANINSIQQQGFFTGNLFLHNTVGRIYGDGENGDVGVIKIALFLTKIKTPPLFTKRA